MKKIIAVLLSASMFFLICACGNVPSNTEASSNTNTLKIAVAGPMTGDNAEYGIGFGNAVDLVARKWNDNGGITVGNTTYQVEVVKYDDKSESDEATTIAYNIVSDPNIIGVIGHFASGICMVAAPIYQQAKYINISPTSSHADYSSIGDYIFRNNTVIDAETLVGVKIAIEDLGGKRIGILSIDTEWGQSAGNEMEKHIVEQGGTVALRQEVSEAAVDFATEIANFKSADADVILVAGLYGTLGPFIVALQNSNYLVPVVGCSNSYTDQMLEYAVQAPDIEVYAPVAFFAGDTDPAVKDYVQLYTETYGAAPSALTTQAYDSADILLESVARAQSLDRKSIQKAMLETNYEGMSGHTTFDEIGDAHKEFTKVTIKNGAWVLA